jgi:hypothetical protein
MKDATVGEKRIGCRILMGKCLGWNLLGTSERGWVDNIRIDVKGMDRGSQVNCIG